jgi:transposase
LLEPGASKRRTPGSEGAAAQQCAAATRLEAVLRTHIARERSHEVQRLEKLLEDSGIKLSSVASDITGVSGRAMLEALIAGQTDPAVIADLAKRTLRRKIPDLTEALVGRFTEHHVFMARLFLDRIDARSADIARLDARIEEAMGPFRLTRELLISIPGFSTKTAEVFIAETGGDMSVFPTAGHLGSWAGVSPGSNESAGRIKSTKTRPGNPHLKGALGVSAMSAAWSKNTFSGPPDTSVGLGAVVRGVQWGCY